MELALTPEEALRRWCDPAAIRAMDDLSYYAERLPIIIVGDYPTHDDIMHQRYRDIREPLERFVVGELRAGARTATALELPMTLKSERIRVPPEFWTFMKLDFKAATAEGNGLSLVEIKIESTPFAQSTPSEPPRSQGPEQCQSIGSVEAVRLSDDNAILILFGKKLIFRGSIQQSILRQLVDAHGGDRQLRTFQVLQKAGSEADSIAKAFRKNPHWPKLERIIRQERGFVWLDLTSPP
jgi:hypothetical protein